MSNKSDFHAVQAQKNQHATPSWFVIVGCTIIVAMAFFFFVLKYPFAP